jgi:hypothetical protein
MNKEHRAAIITGAAQGIGRRTAELLAQRGYNLAVPTENSVPINQHPCGTLIADFVDALSLLASTSESKCWQSLPRPVVECKSASRCREFLSRKNPVLIIKSSVA